MEIKSGRKARNVRSKRSVQKQKPTRVRAKKKKKPARTALRRELKQALDHYSSLDQSQKSLSRIIREVAEIVGAVMLGHIDKFIEKEGE